MTARAPLVVAAGKLRQQQAGDTLAVPASTSTAAGLNLAPGAAPSSPNSGDVWVTGAGLFVCVAGAVVGPLVAASTSMTASQFACISSSGMYAPGQYEVDTSGGPVTITLEGSPAYGDNYTFADPYGTWAANHVTLNPNGATIAGSGSSFALDVAGADPVTIVYKSGNWSLQ